MITDITAKLRESRAFRRSVTNEMHEKDEKCMGTGGDLSSISSFSSQIGERPNLGDDAFYGILGQIVRKHKGLTEADPAAILAQLLTGIGNVIGRTAYFVADGARHHANLFTIICGRTAKARKGTSWARASSVLRILDPEWLEQRVKSGVVSGEGITQVFAEDEDKRLLLFEGEFAQVLQAMRRDGNTVSVLLRQAWDGARLAVLRRKDRIEVDGAHISLIGHVTLPELNKLLDSVEISNGTANRCMWVFADRACLLPDGGKDLDLQQQVSILKGMMKDEGEKGEIKRDPDAGEYWKEIYSQLSVEQPGRLGEILSRAEAQVMRVALIHAVLDGSRMIKTAHLKAGLAFWRYCEASAAYIFGNHLLSRPSKRILEFLQVQRQATMTEIHRLFSNNQSSSQIESALQELKSLIEVLPTDHGGGHILRLAR